MSLRYRLFLWISGLFVVVAICSFFLENYVSRKELAKAQKIVHQKILDMSEARRLDMQQFLAESIAENQVRIDAILNNLVSFSPLALRFGPTELNAERGTWGDASDLLLEYKWVDFLQSTNQGKVGAVIIPEQSNRGIAYRVPIDEELSWIYLNDLEHYPEPCFAVRVPYSFTTHAQMHEMDTLLGQVHGVIPEMFLLFETKSLMAPSTATSPVVFQDTSPAELPPIPVVWTEGYELDVAPFVAAFQRGRKSLLSGQLQPPQLARADIEQKMQEAASGEDGLLSPIPKQTLMSSLVERNRAGERLEEVALRYTQVNVIWMLLALFESGIFGKDLFAGPAPLAATVFSTNNAMGIGVSAKRVLAAQPLFDDAAYYASHTPPGGGVNLATSLAIVPARDVGHVFLGNTAEFAINSPQEERTGFLTLGIDADGLLQKVVMALHQAAILVHEKSPMSAYDAEGKKLNAALDLPLEFSQMLQEKSGVVPWRGQNWFYLHVQPFAEVDLHFFLLNPEEKEFALLRSIQTGSQLIVSSILLNIHIAGFVALLVVILIVHNIARRITRPIIQLAKATGHVVEGNLDQIQLTLPPLKHQDEVAVLCHSFEEMVKGLQEKEKVKGVLNKVVSREIAQEILKGSVHLGGEEKKVSVLFADIRDFTTMTQRMQPQEVIELLNVCMTRISRAVDQNNGVIDKYVGDELMALFGAPIARETDTLSAIRSAVQMMQIVEEWNRERALKSQPAIELGIGIHTGQMLVGNMGAENRLNYTVIGSNVNLAARLCSAAKRMEILVTKDTLDQPFVRDQVLYEAMPPIALKGFDEKVAVFRIRGLK